MLPRHAIGLLAGYGGLGLLIEAALFSFDLHRFIIVLCLMVCLGLLCGGAFDSLTATLFGFNRRQARYEGMCAPGFEACRSTFQRHFELGVERQAQCVAYIDGKKVVDLCGAIDDDMMQGYNSDSLQHVFRCVNSRIGLPA